MFKSEIVTSAVATPETNRLVLDSLASGHQGPVQYMVLKSEYSGQEIYSALAGGEIVGDDINLTPVGTGAYEALSSLPGDEIQLFALSDNDEVMARQIPSILAQQKTGSRLCFISANLVERQQQIMNAFALPQVEGLAV